LGGEVLPVDLMPATAGYHCLTRRVPRGPVLAIGPFNFPLNLLAHKIAPALAVGAPVVVKPPPQAPTAALLLGELLAKLAPPRWPDGFFSILPCDNEIAERLVRDARFAVLSFTGSGPVGWRLKALAVRQHVVLELGGDAAVIVAEDADLEATARRIAWGAMAYAGQVCISVQRVIVQAGVYPAFAARLAEAVRAIPSGLANDARTLSGSVIDDRAAARIERTIEEAAKQGTLLAGGPSRSQRLIAPTLLTDVPLTSPLATDEVFGPVAAIWPYERFEDALELVNRSEYGLQAGLFTYDLRRMFAAHERLRVGGLIVNDIPTLRVDNYPYGGTKGSGLGREGGRSGVDEYTEPRVLVVNPR
jgi:acyl-CoA reductase-like NAD-dependent aldehyde dehydrogenase